LTELQYAIVAVPAEVDASKSFIYIKAADEASANRRRGVRVGGRGRYIRQACRTRSQGSYKVAKWQTLSTKPLCRTPIFELDCLHSRHPQRGERDFFVLKAPSWVNIIPITLRGEVVMVRQYRHGIEDMTLEIPGGMVDGEDTSPLIAARREMQEETGYDSAEIIELGKVHPNPAILNNFCYSFLARNAVKTSRKRLDIDEATQVVRYPLDRIPWLITRGKITHALTIAAFHFLALLDHGDLGVKNSRAVARPGARGAK
jgi:ADP-ribose pyrophosphatase